MKKGRWPALFFAALFVPLSSGCTVAWRFGARNTLAPGLIGKSWQSGRTLDASVVNTSGVSNQPLIRHWDVLQTGTTAQVGSTLWDRFTGNYHSFAMRYVDGTGWDAPGASFGDIASLAAGDLGVTLMAPWGSSGAISIGFADTTASVLSDVGAGSFAWQTPIENALVTATDFPQWLATADFSSGTPLTGAQDDLGNITLSYLDNGGGAGWVRAALFRGAAALPITSAFSFTVSSTSVTANTPLSMQFDGTQYVCAVYHLSTLPPAIDLTVSCRDPVNLISVWTAETQFSGPTGTSVSHAMASDGAGTLRVIVMMENGGQTHPYATEIVSGAWSGTYTQLDNNVPSNFTNYTTAQAPGTAPAIAYLGDDLFQAVWLGVDSSGLTSKLFYSLYDPSLGQWTDALEVTNTEESFTAIAHQRSFDLFSNTTLSGQSGLAVNWVLNEATDVRQLRVARFDYYEGWVLPATYGTGCDPLAGANLAACSLRPRGAILPSGETVVIYADDDSNANTHLMSAELR